MYTFQSLPAPCFCFLLIVPGVNSQLLLQFPCLHPTASIHSAIEDSNPLANLNTLIFNKLLWSWCQITAIGKQLTQIAELISELQCFQLKMCLLRHNPFIIKGSYASCREIMIHCVAEQLSLHYLLLQIPIESSQHRILGSKKSLISHDSSLLTLNNCH